MLELDAFGTLLVGDSHEGDVNNWSCMCSSVLCGRVQLSFIRDDSIVSWLVCQDAEFQQSLAADHQKALRAAQEAEERRRQDEEAVAAAAAQERVRQEELLRLQHAQEVWT